jgi:hydrogenase nickel incorporation protein HypA/HybF
MHELSVAHAIVTTVVDALPDDQSRVTQVTVRIGALSGVVPQALQFAYEVAADGTRLADAILVIERTPVVVFCSPCNTEVELAGTTDFTCPNCGHPSGDVRSGEELQVASITLDDEPALSGGSR